MNKVVKFLPVLVLVLFTLVIFRPFWQENKLPIPADTIVGLYHPWRDYYSSTNPNGLPFKNFLITDPVRQHYVWRELAIIEFKAGRLPGWNPYSLSGTPLSGNLQAAAFYPLNIVHFLGDFSHTWSLQIVFQVLFGGIFILLYLKNLKLHPLAQTLGALSWVGSGFFVGWLEWNTLVQVAIWLPLLLLTVDKFFTSSKKLFWPLIFILSLSCSFLAGHLQIFFYVFAFTTCYLFFRLLETKRWKPVVPFLVSVLISILLTAWQWIAVLDLFKYGLRSIDYSDWLKSGWFIPWQHLIQFVVPDYFGNPATLNYFGVWNYGEMLGYFGISGLIFSIFSLIFLRKNRTVLFFASAIFICLLFALPTPFAKIPFQINIPFLSSAQPTRLLVLIDFSFAILSAVGLDLFLREKSKRKNVLFPICFVLILLISLSIFAYKNDLTISLRNLAIPVIAFIFVSVLSLVSLIKQKSSEFLVPLAVIGILIITFFDLSRLSTKFESFSDPKYLFPKTKTIEFLQKKLANSPVPFRIATTDDRLMPPNFAAHYGIEDISGYDSIFLSRYAQLITAFGRNKADISEPLGFNRMIVPKVINNSSYSTLHSMLAVKYILTLDELKNPYYKLVFEEGQTKVYENSAGSNEVHFVKKVIPAATKIDALNKILEPSFLYQLDAIVEGFHSTGPAYYKDTDLRQYYFNPKNITIQKNTANELLLRTDNKHQGFLVWTSAYHPSWKATIDDVETKIYLTNYAFKGIIVPEGKHDIRFLYK